MSPVHQASQPLSSFKAIVFAAAFIDYMLNSGFYDVTIALMEPIGFFIKAVEKKALEKKLPD